MLWAVGRPEAELSVLLCEDGFMAELNATWRGREGPTDVLAFPMQEGEGGELHPELLGDVVISLQTARRQATALGRPLAAEVRMLLAHGLLHLLGYDHVEPDEERRMKAATDVLLAAARRAHRSRKRRSTGR